jgi:hypothetical protein
MSGTLDRDLAGLATLSSTQLRETWGQVTGRIVPKVSPKLLRLALAWEMQAKVHGGLSRLSQQRLDQLAVAKTRTSNVRPGMRLVREWNGVLHVVEVREGKVICWNNQEWRSLSEVARAITGTRWSGPAFFGLKRKIAA